VQVYLPYSQRGMPFLTAVLRTTGDPSGYVPVARRAVQAIDPDLPIANPRTMDELIAQSVGQRRLSMLLLSVFSGIALVLASIGIYGLMSYSVAQRSRELGVRIALGAGRSDVLRLVLRQGMRLAGMGIVVGVAAAFALTRVIASQLYGVTATDPTTFLAVAALLGLTALAANLVPALRATRVDPAVILRDE
jgi:putative ABC transport system permease protein